jgi:hypothetical protein
MRTRIALVLAVATLTLAPPAFANTAEDQYNLFLYNHGVGYVLGNGNSALSQGYQECEALRAGKSETWLIGQLESQLDRASSGDVVYAAHRYLCPDA